MTGGEVGRAVGRHPQLGCAVAIVELGGEVDVVCARLVELRDDLKIA